MVYTDRFTETEVILFKGCLIKLQTTDDTSADLFPMESQPQCVTQYEDVVKQDDTLIRREGNAIVSKKMTGEDRFIRTMSSL